MERPVESVDVVSDGILVRFSDGMLTYFPHDFLRSHVGIGSNQVFLERSAPPETRTFVISSELLRQVN